MKIGAKNSLITIRHEVLDKGFLTLTRIPAILLSTAARVLIDLGMAGMSQMLHPQADDIRCARKDSVALEDGLTAAGGIPRALPY